MNNCISVSHVQPQEDKELILCLEAALKPTVAPQMMFVCLDLAACVINAFTA
jgi:hypothetical protein